MYCVPALADISIEVVVLRAPSRQSVSVGFGLRNMISDAVAPCDAHANHMERDAHGHVVRISRDFDVTTGMKSSLELSSLDIFRFMLAIQSDIVVRGGLSGLSGLSRRWGN